MTISQFRGSAEARQRYWARSFVGWPRFAAAQPNQGHRAVAALQAAGLVVGLITQNVDGLHQAAGSDDVIELHGALARVRCLRCQELMARSDVQDQLRELNPDVGGGAAGVLPDGDVALPDELAAEFHSPRCPVCHSDLVTPDVVFFGDSVPEARVRRCYSLVEAATSVVVLGSSLAVMSGFRFVRHAASLGRPVAIVTKGDTRADGLASIRLRAELGPALATLAEELGTTHGSGAAMVIGGGQDLGTG
jgi:NAD-dependent SIR2 family protein deacetylase